MVLALDMYIDLGGLFRSSNTTLWQRKWRYVIVSIYRKHDIEVHRYIHTDRHVRVLLEATRKSRDS